MFVLMILFMYRKLSGQVVIMSFIKNIKNIYSLIFNQQVLKNANQSETFAQYFIKKKNC